MRFKFKQEWILKAMSFDKYLENTQLNVPTMKQNYHETEIKSKDHHYFVHLSKILTPQTVKILAISEPWCGDCVENLPIVAKLCSLYPCFRLLVFSRDDNLDIMDLYLTNGKRIIPIFVLFDNEGTEIGRFIERPKAATDFLDQERKGEIYNIRTRMRKLYKTQFRDETIKEIRRILENRYGSQNT